MRPTNDRTHYSVITRCELFAGHETDEELVRRLLAPYVEVLVDRSTAERAGRLRRGFTLSTPHALIASSALENELVFVTRNTRNFQAVRGLKLQQRR